MEVHRQHLIDPVICIRCNTCEEICPRDAIVHDENNYVVKFDVCNSCRACVPPCPTGAIDNWLMVSQPWSLQAQYGFEELPPETQLTAADLPQAQPVESTVVAVIDNAMAATGRTPPPYSAAHPYVNIYNRDAPAIATVAGNFRLTDKEASSDIRHIVLDFGQQAFPVLEGQSIGIIPPGVDEKGRSHLIRLYSVASPRDGERPNHNNISLTVKRVIIQQEDGSIHRGIGSNYVCDLQRAIRSALPARSAIVLMPNHPQANIVMICTGTGSAPFRAFTERRRRRQPDAPGKLSLFFGARSPGELPYFGPLTKLPETLIEVNFAFSRVPGQPKAYVQDKMRERAGDMAELLRSADTFIYICGLKGMERGVEEALADICRHHGMDWGDVRNRLRREGRFHVETYWSHP